MLLILSRLCAGILWLALKKINVKHLLSSVLWGMGVATTKKKVEATSLPAAGEVDSPIPF